MSPVRKKTIKISQKYHEYIHLLFGFVASLVVLNFYPTANIAIVFLIGLSMSLLPDIDHLFYFYIYGKNSKYSKHIKNILKKKGVFETLKVCKSEHKDNTGIYSHNFLLVLILMFLAYKNLNSGINPLLAIFFLSWSFHYIYDIFEDLLYFGKLNPNWYLKFNKKRD